MDQGSLPGLLLTSTTSEDMRMRMHLYLHRSSSSNRSRHTCSRMAYRRMFRTVVGAVISTAPLKGVAVLGAVAVAAAAAAAGDLDLDPAVARVAGGQMVALVGSVGRWVRWVAAARLISLVCRALKVTTAARAHKA